MLQMKQVLARTAAGNDRDRLRRDSGMEPLGEPARTAVVSFCLFRFCGEVMPVLQYRAYMPISR